jgi:metal-responsive CopG/Arc/MetJ family transcriptional regulator
MDFIDQLDAASSMRIVRDRSGGIDHAHYRIMARRERQAEMRRVFAAIIGLVKRARKAPVSRARYANRLA